MKNHQVLLNLSMVASLLGNRFLQGTMHNVSFAFSCLTALIAFILYRKNASQAATGDLYLLTSAILLQLMEFIVGENESLLPLCLIIAFGLMVFGGLKNYLASYKTVS